jgi:hypothetical protein
VAVGIARAGFAAALLGFVAAWPTGLESCAVAPLTALFTPRSEPLNVEAFNNGDLGIVHPWYRRRVLVAVYRELRWPGAKPSDLETPAVQAPTAPAAQQQWLDARASAGAQPVPGGFINPNKWIAATSDYIVNCNDDAFLTAKATLEARGARYGIDNPRSKTWLAAQDMVFQNCSAGPAIPQPLPPDAAALDRADRQYQIAAAHFYSGQFELARDEFLAIGNDPQSPWSDLGSYLAARAMIRMGALEDAEKQLRSIRSERAGRLLKTVEARLRPVETMAGTAHDLASQQPNNILDLAASYAWMYQILSYKPGQIERVAAVDDMTDWIHTFQLAGGAPRGYAGQRWQATRDHEWLIAALYSSAPEDPLIAAADELKAADPGFLSAQYFAALALERSGQDAGARSRLNRLLEGKWSIPERNTLLAARMKLATTWQDFLRDAIRTPAGEDGYDYSQRNPDVKRYDPKAPGLDADAVAVFQDQIPLRLFSAAIHDPKLPSPIRVNLAIAAWTRDIILNRLDAARSISPILEQHIPGLRSDMEAFRKSEGEAATFAAVFALLRNPGLHSGPRTGWGRLTPANQRDMFRDNWWCQARTAEPLSPVLREIYGQGRPVERFLSEPERQAAKAEAQALAAAPSAPDFLAEKTLRWAQQQPNDSRLPEALHLVVQATRYGCGSDATHEYSKRAFTVLHERYPTSEFAKKTRYWY